mgnify:CR=1 FL=1
MQNGSIRLGVIALLTVAIIWSAAGVLVSPGISFAEGTGGDPPIYLPPDTTGQGEGSTDSTATYDYTTDETLSWEMMLMITLLGT